MINENDLCNYSLSKICRWEPRVAKLLAENFGSAFAVFGAAEKELDLALGPFNKIKDAILRARLTEDSQELERILDNGNRMLTIDNDCYPALLAECDDAPLCLFVRGKSEFCNIFKPHTISIVGTRDASPYGIEWCRKLVRALAETDFRPTIVSGLAYGIDITGQLAALNHGLPTIAVLGTGIDSVYPRRHERYARQMMETDDSAVISEYGDGAEVSAINFLSRNRIIAGMSEATILIESRLKGGGMVTARLASSYCRSVFALPGRNDDVRSQGCNMLIHTQIADALISCDEMLKALGYKCRGKSGRTPKTNFKELYTGSIDKDKLDWPDSIIKVIAAEPGITVKDVAFALDLPYKDVLAIIWRLESDGFVDIDILQRCSATGT